MRQDVVGRGDGISVEVESKMMRRTHLASALLFFVVFWSMSPNPMPLGFSLSILPVFCGALIPDLDLRLLHRKLLHNIWAMTIYGLAVFYILRPYFQGSSVMLAAILASAGYFSHLLMDSLTPKGVWWLYPLGGRLKGPIRTGSALNKLVGFVFLTLVAWIAFHEVWIE